jgi:stage II sporulation protein GA (sporulation sigma-E factor processing peptidase)
MVTMTVYADVLFLINLAVDYIALLVSAKICASPVSRLRLLAAAAFGALYAVAVVLPFGAVLSHPFLKLAAGALMVLAAFAGQRRLLRLTLVFFAVSAAFGGAVMAATLLGGKGLGGVLRPVDMRLLAVAFVVSYIVLTLVFRRTARHRKGEIVPLTLRHGGREVRLRALRDTGNALTDPMSGRSVVVVGVGDLRPLFPQTVRSTVSALNEKNTVRVLEELSCLEHNMRFQLVPYSAVGVTGGMLLAFKPDEIVIDGRKKTGMLLALSPNSVSDGGPYTALLGA